MLLPIVLAVGISGSPSTPTLVPNAAIDAAIREIVEQALVRYKPVGLKADEIGIALVELEVGSTKLRTGSYRGDSAFYPASVVKLFYLAYAEHLVATRKLKRTEELDRALEDMIRDSSNDATHYVLDATTGTTGGVELSPREFERWKEKRQSVNRWFASQGYEGVNACQKTWCEGPYGREAAFVGKDFANRNRLTPLATARLMTEIALGACVSQDASATMLNLLSRKIPADSPEADNQSKEFTGDALPKGAKLWSKAGWTSTTKHDVALVELPNGTRLVLAIFTKNHSNEKEILPWFAGKLLEPYLRG